MNADQDEVLTCQNQNCRREFTFTARDKAFFASQGYTPPKRCKACREAAKASREQGQATSQGFGASSQDRAAPRHNTSGNNGSRNGSSNGPIVQYRSRAVADNFSRTYGPSTAQATPPKAQTPARAQTTDRRTDAFSERRARKRHHNRNWQEQDAEG